MTDDRISGPGLAKVSGAQSLILRFRRPLVVLVHEALFSASFFASYLLRFDFQVSPTYWGSALRWLVPLLLLRSLVGWYFGMFHGLWRYTSARDLTSLIKAMSASSLLFVALTFLARIEPSVPRTVFFVDWLLAIALVGGLRLGIRTLRETVLAVSSGAKVKGKKRVLIVGAGDAAETLVREILRAQERRYEPVGFVDDDISKQGLSIHGVPVLGPVAEVATMVKRGGVDEVIIAIPSASRFQMRAIIDMCEESGAPVRTVPGVDSLVDGRVTLGQLRNVAIEDLLRREPVSLDTNSIAEFLRGRTVMVTGAGGSIGSELCRQICHFGPARLVLVEQAENNLFFIHRALLEEFPGQCVEPRIADICDSRRLEQIFADVRPSVVYHAAAHKHVPMMEANPGEAIKNNIFGTRKVADFAHQYGVQKFVMVSTDKAVNPTSIMGTSKRIAEIYIQALSQRSKTQFITVRFGNVLGSTGSVIPIFRDQIAKGGPITITHPDMTRYFMTIPEASQLILQAATMGQGGEIFVLDMGEPVKIVDLARDLIRLSGLHVGEDIEIKFTGVRPGEKLFEELAVDSESMDKTVHPKIFIGRFRPHAWEEILEGMEVLHSLSDALDPGEIRRALHAVVPEYRPPGTSSLPAIEPPPSGDTRTLVPPAVDRSSGNVVSIRAR